jgi:hypothetical protein
MLTTLAFLAALPLAPAQQGTLALNNARITYGILGPARADTKVLPGDNLAVQFDIDNISVDKEGQVEYSTTLEVVDPAGKSIFTQPPQKVKLYNTLGGNSLPGSAAVYIGLEQPAGEYTVKVSVTDELAKKSASFSQKFTVLPKAFGLIGLTGTVDPDGRVPAGILSVGESLFVNLAVIGFGRGATKQPNLTVELTILDANGKATLPKPFTLKVDDKSEEKLDEKALVLPVQFLVSLNRAGQFTLELKATDQINNKTVTQKVPFTVVAR